MGTVSDSLSCTPGDILRAHRVPILNYSADGAPLVERSNNESTARLPGLLSDWERQAHKMSMAQNDIWTVQISS
jgi:hypothetical protein